MRIEVDESKCTGCGICQESCAVGAIAINEKAHINPDECILCGACIADCPEQALSLGGMAERSALSEPLDDSGTRDGYGQSGDPHRKGPRDKGKGGFWSWFK